MNSVLRAFCMAASLLFLRAEARALDFTLLGHGIANQQSASSALGSSESNAYLTYGAGLRLSYALHSSLEVESGAHYLTRQTGYESTSTSRFKQIQIPVHLKFWVSRFAIAVGGFVSHGLGSVERNEGSTREISYDQAFTNKLELGFAAELAYVFSLSESIGLVTQASYQRSLTNASTASGVEAYNQSVILSVGLRWGAIPGQNFLY